MAYVNDVPWHGLGKLLTAGMPIEVWAREAGMEWEAREGVVHFSPGGEQLRPFASHKVLYRSDTLAPLSVMSDRYKVVQPREVLEFYRDMVEQQGFQLETAGVLKGGRKVWALAKTGVESFVAGADRLKAYLLLATGYDGTLATTAQYTSVRVVCNNTLQMAVGQSTGAIKVPHHQDFDPRVVKDRLGLGLNAWDRFMEDIRLLAATKVTEKQARKLLVEVLGDPAQPVDQQSRQKLLENVYSLFQGKAVGADLPSARGTLWGLLNSITEHIDHHNRTRAPDSRLHSAWFGQGALIKRKALQEALKLAA